MLLAGDEILRTQRGNNNAYCQDNALSWMDWHLSDDALDMLRFVREMIALRKRHASLRHRRFLTGRPANGQSIPMSHGMASGSTIPHGATPARVSSRSRSRDGGRANPCCTSSST